MDKQTVKEIIAKYNKGLASTNEIKLLENWYAEKSGQLNLSDDEIDFDSIEHDLREKTFAHAGISEQPYHRRLLSLWPRYIAAASVILALCVGSYLLFRPKPAQQSTGIVQNQIIPGSNKAILTLGNGKHISLTNAKNGIVAVQANKAIQKTADGLIKYDAASPERNSSAVVYNTVATPRGGQYHLILADGTNVWLNAASYIKYPTTFAGKERLVELTGEAYFEVAHNKRMPFRVKTANQVVEVLGTHFNINSYADEPGTTTTLLQGSVKVSNDHTAKIIKPGQQAYLNNNAIQVSAANTAEAVAWKDGYFRFNNENVESIMRKLSRWYDINISYEGESSNIGFYGKISRFKNISQVLHLMEKTNRVHFTIEERRIIVKK